MHSVKITSIAVLSVFILAITLLFLPLFNAPSGMMLFGDDLFRSYGFFRQFFAQSISSGQIPWWNPYLFSGMPFMANPSVSSFYPINWLYVFFPLDKAFPLITAIHLMIAALGMYWLGRKAIKPALGVIPACSMGLAFACSGYMSARIWAGHTEIIAAASYMPWVIGIFIRTYEQTSFRNIIFSALILALQIISGYQTIAMFTLEAVGLITLLYTLKQKSLRSLIAFGVATVFAGLLSFFQLWPYLEFYQHSIRVLEFPYTWAVNGSYMLKNFILLVQPFAFGDQKTFTGPPPNFHEHAAFVGITNLLLALVSLLYLPFRYLFRITRKKPVHQNTNIGILTVAFLLIAVFGLWVSLGQYAPFNLHNLLWQYIPTYRTIRIPARHLLLSVFSLTVLAGIGMNSIKIKYIQIILMLLMIGELFTFARFMIELRPVPGTAHDPKLVRVLKQEKQPVRLLQNFGVWVQPRDALDFDATPIYGISSVTGYDPSILADYYAFADAVNRAPAPSILSHDVQIPYLDEFSPYLDYLNIGYVMVPVAYDPTEASPQRYRRIITETARDYHLSQNLDVLPRFFMISGVEYLSDRESVIDALKSGRDLSKTILLNSRETGKPTQLLDCPSNAVFMPVEITSYKLNEITLKTDTQCNAILSSSEVYYPGWTATIDGHKAQVLNANLAFRAVAVPKGQHTVVFKFIPYAFIRGTVVSLAAVLVIMIFAVKFRKK